MNVTIEDGVNGGIIEDAAMFASSALSNYGAWVDIRILGNTWKQLIMVDLSGYANISSIQNAYFGLTFWTVNPSIARWYKVLKPWGEGTGANVSALTGECSWNYSERPTTWTSPGCSGAGTDRSETEDGNKATAAGLWTMPISSELVLDWAGSSTNYGVVISHDGTTQNATGESSEAPSDRPFFYMEYTTYDPVPGKWILGRFVHDK